MGTFPGKSCAQHQAQWTWPLPASMARWTPGVGWVPASSRSEGKWAVPAHAAAKAEGGRSVGLVEDLSRREERAQGRQSFCWCLRLLLHSCMSKSFLQCLEMILRGKEGLKTSKDWDCTTSQGNLFQCISDLMVMTSWTSWSSSPA